MEAMAINHEKQWNFLKRKFDLEQLSHAYLFSGKKQIGKNDFAKEFIKLINCQDQRKPCQKCANCQTIEKGSFPDFMLVEPEDGKEISISKIREVQNFLSYKPYYSSACKSVIINNAEKMNWEAQSCFLKTLEEPKGKTILILISSKADMLLPTIFSRCQAIKFLGKPVLSQLEIDEEKKLLQELLKILGGGFSEKFKYVKSLDLDQQKLSSILEVFQKYLRYLLFFKIGIKQQAEQKYFSSVPAILEDYPIPKIKEIINLSEDINNKMIFTNASPKLALEILLMEFQQN